MPIRILCEDCKTTFDYEDYVNHIQRHQMERRDFEDRLTDEHDEMIMLDLDNEMSELPFDPMFDMYKPQESVILN